MMSNAPMNIPFLGIKRFYKNHSEEILDIVNSIYSKGQVLMGPEIESLENNISSLCNRKFGVAVGSCTDALYYALVISGIGKGDEVLVTSFSFIATVTPILRIGAIPVFVDIDPHTCLMDLDDLEKKITSKSKAIVAVHLYSQMLQIKKLTDLGLAHNLVIIEDAAQSFGAKNLDIPSGSTGLLSCTSFDPTKVVAAFGSGGMLLTNDLEAYEQARKLRYHGKNMKSGVSEILGYNSRMSTLQAALLNFQLTLAEGRLASRNKTAEMYNDLLSKTEGVEMLEVHAGNTHTFHKYVIKVERRDGLRESLHDSGIQTQVHYEATIFEHPVFQDYEYRAENLTAIHQVKREVLSLPIYPELEKEEIEYVCEEIKNYF